MMDEETVVSLMAAILASNTPDMPLDHHVNWALALHQRVRTHYERQRHLATNNFRAAAVENVCKTEEAGN